MIPWPPDPFDRIAGAIAAVFVAIVSGALGGTGPPSWETDTMPKLSPVELAELVTLYNFPDRTTAVAVILGESGGDPTTTNREPDNIDRGLWQISSKWHPEVSDDAAYDVQRSTEAALRISSGGTDFNPWNATKAPTFAGHRATAAAAVAEYDASTSGGARGGGVGSGGGGAGRGSDDTGAGRPWWQSIPINPLDPFGGPDLGDALGAGGKVIDGAGSVAGGISGAVAGVGDVLGYLGRGLSILTSGDFWKRAGFALAGLALLAIGLRAIFAPQLKSLAGAAVSARTGGAVQLSDDDDE